MGVCNSATTTMRLMKKRCVSLKASDPNATHPCPTLHPLPPLSSPGPCLCSQRSTVLTQGQARTLYNQAFLLAPALEDKAPFYGDAWWQCEAPHCHDPYKIETKRAAGSIWCELSTAILPDEYSASTRGVRHVTFSE